MLPTIIRLLKYESPYPSVPFQKQIAEQIIQNNWYPEIIEIIDSQKAPLPFRAAWGLETAYIMNQELFLPHVHIFLKSFFNVKDESARRHYGKIMYLLLERRQLILASGEGEKCAETVCEWMNDSKAKIGNKVWCMDILSFLVPYAGWIKDILYDLIEKEMQAPTPGLLCRIKKIKSRLSGKCQ